MDGLSAVCSRVFVEKQRRHVEVFVRVIISPHGLVEDDINADGVVSVYVFPHRPGAVVRLVDTAAAKFVEFYVHSARWANFDPRVAPIGGARHHTKRW